MAAKDAGPDAVADFRRALGDIKQRSGKSYEQLQRDTDVRRSTLQRYVTGESFPRDFAVIEKIARACDATTMERDNLYRLWCHARDERQGLHAADQAGLPVAAAPAPAPAPADHSRAAARPIAQRVRLRMGAAVAALLVAAGVAAAVVVVERRVSAPPRPTLDAQQVTGPAWAQAPTRVPPQSFGVTLNSTSGAMPDFQVGAVRLWDSRTRWANIEPSRGAYDWTVPDRLVAGAEGAQLPVLFTFGGTPGWASPAGPRTAYDDDSRTSPPDELGDWDRFVTAVARRYRGRIEAYELWDLASSPRFWSGDVLTLAEMTRRAAEAIRREDPQATIVCPSVGDLWTQDTRDLVTRFAEAGGYQSCDVAGVKLHAADLTAAPETSIPIAQAFDSVLHQAGVRLRLWNTGTGYGIADVAPLPRDRANDYAARFWLVGLYVRYERMYFYNWGSRRVPLVLQAEGGPPTQAARGVEELQRWLDGARVRSCGRGPDDGTPAGAWQCSLVLPAVDGGPAREAAIQWTDDGALDLPAAATDRLVHHLDGRVETLPAGAPLSLTGSPVLVEQAPVAAQPPQ